jgi:ATP-dependent protease ClpP protease subunit
MKNNTEDNQMNIQIGSGDKPYISITEVSSKRIDVFLDKEIGEPSDYRDLNFLLFNAEENDVVPLYINSPGGHLNTALAIIEGLKNTPARTVAILQGECHSAASMITMYCDEVLVLDSAHMMIHTASYGTVGNTGNVKAHTEFTTRQVERLIHETYEGFLTESEIEKVKLGVELWLDADEIRQRIEKRVAYLEKKAAQAEAAEKKAAKVPAKKAPAPKRNAQA